MELVITAVGPDHEGLADPIIHHVTARGANISEIQMYDHDQDALFAMMLRARVELDSFEDFQQEILNIGEQKQLSTRVWNAEPTSTPRVAICTTKRLEPARAVLEAITEGTIAADPVVMIGNREHGQSLAAEYDVDWHNIGDASGTPEDDKMVQLLDAYRVDYVVLARYMRVLPAATCWKFAGGRIINLHHGLLPGFPGMRPYHDAYAVRMLAYGATCHFIVPELDAGNQIVNQSTFHVEPGTELADIIREGERKNEPACLVEGLRRVVSGEVRLHFHRVIRNQHTPV